MSDAVSILSTQLQGQLASPSAWLVGTTYTAGQAVSRSGLNYYAIQGSTGADPATDGGVNWGLLSGSGPQPVTLSALSRAIVAGARAVVTSRQANRVTLLSAVIDPAALPQGSTVGNLAQAFLEVQAANSFLGAATSFDGGLAPIRATDSMGNPATAFIANTTRAQLIAWANALVTSAAAFETLEAEALLTV